MPRDIRACLSDIVDACRAIEAAVSGLGHAGHAESRQIRSTVEREFIITGEAIAALSHVSASIFERQWIARAVRPSGRRCEKREKWGDSFDGCQIRLSAIEAFALN